jgi:hypothetical protein
MSKQLRQPDTNTKFAGCKLATTVGSVPLCANFALALVLIILLTHSGVALIA